MSADDTPEAEKLFAQGMTYFRSAQWQEAIDTFSQLRAASDQYPEIEALIADARLKSEIERVALPLGARPARKNRRRAMPVLVVLAACLLIGGLVAAVLRLPVAATSSVIARPTNSVALPTRAPTATALPTATLEPAQQGMVQVRMAGDQQLFEAINTIQIILDASGSMLGRVAGQRKIEIAHESLTALVDRLPDTTSIALRTYGRHRSGDCNDIELVSPLAPLNRTMLVSQIQSIVPVPEARTPMGLSLQQVSDDLKSAQGDALVVLVSDGDETCDGDPVQVAGQLHAANPRLRVSVIGFNVGPEDWRKRLQAIALNGGGSYFDAADATQLAEALQQAVTLTYRLLDSAGAQVYSGPIGSTATLPVGRYLVEISGQATQPNDGLEIKSGQTTVVEVHKQNGVLASVVSS